MDLIELEKNGEIDAKIKDNGKYDAENNDGKSLDENVSPPPAATKGRGLRKWRRIRRESGKETNASLDSNRKRGSTAFPLGTKQKSEGSSSSTNAISNALDLRSPLSVDFGGGFAARADSENSRSSTAASGPRAKNLGVSGNNLGFLAQSGDQMGKSRSDITNKKARGFRIKKENSISSVESDSRSSNFVFVEGSNGRQSCRLGNYEEDYSDDARNGDRCLNEEGVNENEADSEEVSHEDLGGENSWEAKEGKVDELVGSGDRDDLVESVMPLHLAQEALEREIQKLRDVGKEDPLSNDTKISDLESILNFGNMKIEHEDILKQRIAAEVEFLVISNTIQNLKTGYKDQMSLTVQQKNIPVSVPVPVPEEVKVEDEGETARKLRKGVFRYAFWFVIQLVLFLVVVYLLVLQFSSQNMEVLPT